MEHTLFLLIFMPGIKDFYQGRQGAALAAVPPGQVPVCLDLGIRSRDLPIDSPEAVLALFRSQAEGSREVSDQGVARLPEARVAPYLDALDLSWAAIALAEEEMPGQAGTLKRLISLIRERSPKTGILVMDTAGQVRQVHPHEPDMSGFRPFEAVWPEFETGLAPLAGAFRQAAAALEFQGPKDRLSDLVSGLAPWLSQPFEGRIFSLHAFGPADYEFLEDRMADLREQGLGMVLWQKDEAGPDLPAQLMWQASKLGIWNHVRGADIFSGTQGHWLANTPNIVHSFENYGSRVTDHKGLLPQVQIPEEILAYHRVTPFDHIPFWQVLADPGAILSMLGTMDKKALLRLRAGRSFERVCRLGENLKYEFIPPANIDAQTMDEIVAMVDAGGAVDITLVRANLEKAYLIALAREEGVIVGNSSLKHPRAAFIERINRISGLDFSGFLERGYTSVRPEYRAMGVGAKLLEGLTQRARDRKIFSIISEDNLATQKIAIRNLTKKVLTYHSDKLGKQMGIWMPEHMIDPEWELQ